MPRKNTKPSTRRKEPTTHASAVAVLELMNSEKCPDFLYAVIKETIENACNYLDPHPFLPSWNPKDTDDVDKSILMACFSRMKKVSQEEFEGSAATLARHIKAVYEHPETPVCLFINVGNFICDGTSIRLSDDDTTLVDEWQMNPKTIAQIVERYNKRDNTEEVSHAAN